MNEKALRILEYNKIIHLLTEYASSEMGKQLCKDLTPSTNLVEIQSEQANTRDALSRLYQHGSVSFLGLEDIRPCLRLLDVGSSLNTKELLQVARLLSIANQVQQYGDSRDEEAPIDSLQTMFEELVPLTSLQQEIQQCILSETEISDEASVGLKDVRKSIKQTNRAIHNKLSSIVNSQQNKTLLQETIVTMRNGRYCIPVKQEYRSSFPGMIHDQSATGSTIFIEPMAVVQLNNELRELEMKEQAEIDKILAFLSEQVSFETENILSNLEILTQLDFIFAKAKLAKAYQGSEPIFNEEGIINIKYARHPLLDQKTVVPIHIHLGEEFSMLIITGPNTGGKTVSLKTLGLFTLMGQAGLHIPAFEGSKLAVFSNVFADIGDEQSIEQNLSTFSSHMTNIVSILENADENSLVLFDELCGGTDPVEGAALAISILSSLHDREIRTMATTHYSELKMFALSEEGIENASCEFDVNTLSPTYHLLIGVPGKSNAFAISKKLGLSPYIIEQAKSQIGASQKDFESLIADLEKSKIQIEKEQAEILATKAEVERLKKSLEQRKEDIAAKRSALLQEARQEAHDIISQAKEMADDSIKKFNQWGKDKTSTNNKKMEHQRSKLRGQLNDLESKLAYRNKKGKGHYKKEDFHIGDPVFVHTLSLEGTVTSLPNAKGDLTVQMGILSSVVNIKDLDLLEKQKTKETTNSQKRGKSSRSTINKAATISSEINLLGKTVDEAIAELDKYLDDAYMSGVHQVRIIHGKGTGALRAGIHSYLKRQKHVKSYRLGVFGEGEAGVTIVEF